MKKLAIIALTLPLAFAIIPASAAKRSDTCYVVREHGKYARAGKPVRKCPVGSRRGDYRIIGPTQFARIRRCIGKPKGYKFVRVVQGRPQLVTCNVRRMPSGLVRPKLRRFRR